MYKHAPIAEPASDGANGIQTFLKAVCCFILPLAVPLYAHPPPKHKLVFDVTSLRDFNIENKDNINILLYTL